MNIPGFTAEASLFDSAVGYRATSELRLYGEPVQPAQSDMYLPHDPPRVTPDLSNYHPRPFPCLKRTCLFWDPYRPWHCRKSVRSVGFLNPVTGFCE